jgi:hypothetical protein
VVWRDQLEFVEHHHIGSVTLLTLAARPVTFGTGSKSALLRLTRREKGMVSSRKQEIKMAKTSELIDADLDIVRGAEERPLKRGRWLAAQVRRSVILITAQTNRVAPRATRNP